jgi:hypothetical protein
MHNRYNIKIVDMTFAWEIFGLQPKEDRVLLEIYISLVEQNVHYKLKTPLGLAFLQIFLKK